MTGNAITHVGMNLHAAMAGRCGRGGAFMPAAIRTEIVGPLQAQDIVQALGGEGDVHGCADAVLAVLATARHLPARTVVSMGQGQPALLEFYVDADVPTCCELDAALQRAIASHYTSVLPPGLAASVRPLAAYAAYAACAAYAQETVSCGEPYAAERFRACAQQLLRLGGEMNQRLSSVCAYLSALYDALETAERLGYLDQSLLRPGQESLSWRLRRHRSVEGRALAQALEGLSRGADDALHGFGTRYSLERASYQFEQMQCFHDQIERLRGDSRPGPVGSAAGPRAAR
ncbi:hypothetical protein [Cupriavidus necator]|uniref:hypothetical protein n=1 Tax=Cupriavidus necator TaxID=106590 RepID=UPI0007C7D2A3|nr:hypothetical protein [Cupriavidus necator]